MKYFQIIIFFLISSFLTAQKFTPILIVDGITSSQGIVAYDFNNDGKKEIINTQFSENKVVLIKEVNGEIIIEDLITTENPKRVGLADFNKDGKMDILLTSFSGKGLTILKNEGNLTFTAKIRNGFDFEKGNEFVIDDFDGDGDDDIIVSSFLNRKIALFELRSSSFISFRVSEIDNNIFQPGQISSGDFNNDGQLDFISCSRSGNQVLLYLNKGNLNFSKTIIDKDIEPIGNVTGDFDNDGYLDFAVTFFKSNKVHLYMNSGNGINFDKVVLDSTIYHPVSISTADFNNDNYLDLVIGYGEGLNIYYNDVKKGNFIKENYKTDKNLSDLFVVDFDEDGDMDILYSIASSGEIYLNNNDLITAVNEPNTIDINIVPNPSIDNIRIIGLDDMDFYYEVFDLNGRLALSGSSIGLINTSFLVKGFYIIKIKIPNSEKNVYKVFSISQ